jgi:hypothetical protein
MPTAQLQYATCKHVLAKGRICGCPALKDHIFCLHHNRDRQRRANLRAGLAAKFRHGQEDFNAEIVASLDLPAPDEPEAVLVCLSNTFLALAAGAIPERRAALMIYNLQTITTALQAAETRQARLKREAAEERAAVQATGNTTSAHEESLLHAVVERAVTDPEPIAALEGAQRQADWEFSEQQYAEKLLIEKQLPNADRTDGTDEPGDLKVGNGCHPERSAQREVEGPFVSEPSAPPRLRGEPASADLATAHAAFNADAHRHMTLESGELPLPAEAPYTDAELQAALREMSDDDWQRYLNFLQHCGFIDNAGYEKLHARIFHASRDERRHARLFALKYAPDKVRKLLEKALSRQPSAVSEKQMPKRAEAQEMKVS